MGKKNRLKHLLGRFNKETGSEILGFPYKINDIVREMYLKIDLEHDTILNIANVPYFLDKKMLKEVCSKALDTPIVHVEFTTSTALHGDLKSGYRSGHLAFASIQNRKRAFEECKLMKQPVVLTGMRLNLPAWHKLLPARSAMKRRLSVGSEEEEEDDKMEASSMEGGLKKTNDDDEWVTVTKEHKLSFHGKVNRIVGEDETKKANETMPSPSPVQPSNGIMSAKKRRRTR